MATTGTQPVCSAARTAKIRDLLRQLYSVVAALEEEFGVRKFTPDGHLVGSIGEVDAAYAFNLKLLPAYQWTVIEIPNISETEKSSTSEFSRCGQSLARFLPYNKISRTRVKIASYSPLPS
jgi:Family of unknown function (DUF6998)